MTLSVQAPAPLTQELRLARSRQAPSRHCRCQLLPPLFLLLFGWRTKVLPSHNHTVVQCGPSILPPACPPSAGKCRRAVAAAPPLRAHVQHLRAPGLVRRRARVPPVASQVPRSPGHAFQVWVLSGRQSRKAYLAPQGLQMLRPPRQGRDPQWCFLAMHTGSIAGLDRKIFTITSTSPIAMPTMTIPNLIGTLRVTGASVKPPRLATQASLQT